MKIQTVTGNRYVILPPTLNWKRHRMSYQISTRIWKILICPQCNGKLTPTTSGAACAQCQAIYTCNADGALDLRLQSPKKTSIEFELGTALATETVSIAPLTMNPAPAVDFTNVHVPHHLSRELLSYFPKASPGSLMLDLGCGRSIHQEVGEHAGFEWVGIDYNSPQAPFLADAHSLPFESNSFDFISSIAVLEHIRFPFVMMREAYRVLKTGGRFLGTVAFLEPFHGDSFYHHSHLGLLNMLRYGGFQVERIAPSAQWSGLTAQASMALFPLMPRPLAQAIIRPVEWLHKFWWWAGGLVARQSKEITRIRNTTGGFAFIASKQ